MPDANPANAPANPAGPHLLIVDDNVQFGASLVAFFRHHDLSAAAVRDGRKALEYLSRHPVRMVITDIFMPECDGLELIRELPRIKPRPRVVAMSGGENLIMPDILRIAGLLGAEATIRKPFEPGQLLRLVSGMLGETASFKAVPPAGPASPAAP